MSNNNDPHVTLVPYSDDILATAAGQIIDHSRQLPNLLDTVILLPDLLFETALRHHLLEAAQQHDCKALLGPHISTPEGWLTSHATPGRVIPDRARRELILVEAIRQHPDVFGDQDPWSLGASLITLFDELTLHRIPVPVDLDSFTRQLQSAYGIPDRLPEPLGLEARVVHRLWQAWHTQLQAEGLLDPGMALLQLLAQHQQARHELTFWFVGFDELNTAEQEWITSLARAGIGHCLLRPSQTATDAAPPTPVEQLRTLASAPTPPASPRSEWLDAVFDTTAGPLKQRATAMGKRHSTSPLTACIQSLATNSAEQEARAIDLQVRNWLLAGHQPIGIVTEDRRLGRRVRALLERAGITLQDPGGWALSTTRAAAALERWLQTVEEDFAHQPLLDVLKSSFVLPEEDREQLANTVFRLETDIIRHGNIARGLQRYHRHIERRLQHLHTTLTADSAQQLHYLLNRLDQAADPLRDCLTGEHPAKHLLAQLRDSLEQLGLWHCLDQDAAGQRVLQEWRQLHDAAQHSTLEMRWSDFRAWLGNALERQHFRPATGPGPVILLTLQQAQLGRFAGLVVAACDSNHLPPVPVRSAFFNDPVRTELGLPAWPQQYRLQRERFRCLLESAPHLLLTWHWEENGAVRTQSPWLALLETFQQLAGQPALLDRQLEAMLNHPGIRVAGNHPLPRPPATTVPRPVLPAEKLPQRISVSAHGSLIDCPYQFFAATGLQLKAREEIRQALEKSDYGSLVHQALEIFHQGRDGYPEPLHEPMSRDNRTPAIARLEQISRRLFTVGIEDNYEHRAWLRRWLKIIPHYIDWQIAHQQQWSFVAGEQDAECVIAGTRRLHGRLDRIDQGAAGQTVLDYKTGYTPEQAAVEAGEAVQLPSYALLMQQPPTRVEYIELTDTVKTGPALEGPALTRLTQAVESRLQTLLQQLESGSPLPAWGDAAVCRYCDMGGLCRKQAWPEPPA